MTRIWKHRGVISKVLIYFMLCLMAVVAVFPLLYTITNSFLSANEIDKYYGSLDMGNSGVNPFHLIPDRVTLSGFSVMLLEKPHYLLKFWTSLGLCGTIVSGQAVLSILGGYAFSKFRFPGRDMLFFMIIALMIMPLQVMLTPSYMVLDRLGLIGSYSSLILPGLFSAFGVFLMRQVMATVPDSLLESARIDGAGSFRILMQILLPSCKAGLFSLIVLSFIDNWNMVEQPLIFLKESFMYPLSVFLLQTNALEPALGFACGLLSMLPVLLLFLYFEDEMVHGIEYSVIK